MAVLALKSTCFSRSWRCRAFLATWYWHVFLIPSGSPPKVWTCCFAVASASLHDAWVWRTLCHKHPWKLLGADFALDKVGLSCMSYSISISSFQSWSTATVWKIQWQAVSLRFCWCRSPKRKNPAKAAGDQLPEHCLCSNLRSKMLPPTIALLLVL